jgi:geranylgeranyl reductase family protein
MKSSRRGNTFIENSYDAIVIGAGPAGSTVAYLLASNGFKVVVLEKSIFPRAKLCGGLITRKCINLLESIFSTPLDFLKSRRIISHQSVDYNVCSSSGATVKGCLEFPFHFVQRKTYDHHWMKAAMEAGAEFQPGEKLVSLNLSTNQVTSESGKHYKAKFVLGADGVLSRVRRILTARGVITQNWKSHLASTLEVFVPNSDFPDFPDFPVIYFGHIPWGYTWSFPGAQDRILGIVGLNRKSGKHLNAGFTDFLKSLQISRQDIPRPQSHALPYGNYLTRPGWDNILLLGDACGLADPLLGEGIYYAHKSAELAARAILEATQDSNSALKKYTDSLNRDIIAELKTIHLARQIIFSLPGLWPFRILSCLLRTIPRLCEETIQGQRSYRWFCPRKSQLW